MYFVKELETAFFMCTYTKKGLMMQIVDAETKKLYFKVCVRSEMESMLLDLSLIHI